MGETESFSAYLEREGLVGKDIDVKSFNDQLNAYLAQINTIITNMAELEVLRLKVATLIEQINKEIETWNKKVTDQNLNAVAFTQFMSENFENLHRILIEKTLIALNSSREYKAPFFATRLMEVVSNDNILDLYMDFAISSTIKNPIKVAIYMDKMAGTKSEYLSAILGAKIAIGKNPGALYGVGKLTENSPKMGAKVFEEKYWGVDEENNRIFRYRRHRKRKFIQVEFGQTGKKSTKATRAEKQLLVDIAAEKNATESGGEDITSVYRGKYHNTLLERAKLFTHPAPFWEFLDKGSSGGGDTIPQAGTDFVGKSEKAIYVKANLEYNKIRDALMKRWGSEFDNLVIQRTKAEKLFAEIDMFIKRTQSRSMQALIQFRENPAELIQKQIFIGSNITQKLITFGRINPSAIAGEINKVSHAMSTGGIVLKSGGRLTVGGQRIRFTKILKDFQRLGK